MEGSLNLKEKQLSTEEIADYENIKNRLVNLEKSLAQQCVEGHAAERTGSLVDLDPPTDGMNEQLELQSEIYRNCSSNKKEIQQKNSTDTLTQIPNYSGNRSPRLTTGF